MRPVILLGLLTVSISGCGGSQTLRDDPIARARADASAAMMSGLAACKQKFPQRKKGEATAQMRCESEAKQDYASQVGHGDLIKVASTRSIEAAERYDAGKISDAQFDVELASIEADLNTGSKTRMAQETLVGAAQQQADSAREQSEAIRRQENLNRAKSIQDAFNPPTTTTNCTTFGNSTNCRSQ